MGGSKEKAIEWAEEQLSSQEVQDKIQEMNDELYQKFRDFMLTGSAFFIVDKEDREIISDGYSVTIKETLSPEEIIEKYGHKLTQKEIERLKNYKQNVKR